MATVREVPVERVGQVVAELCRRANTQLPADVVTALERARAREDSALGGVVLDQILENVCIARTEGYPLCQDTGVALVFMEVGQDVHLVGGSLAAAVNAGVREGYRSGRLRASILDRPWGGKNTIDNTPAVIHIDLVPGDRVRITFVPKGAGCENMSALTMLSPSDGLAGVKEFVLKTVRRAGPNACPPLVIGVGIGGTFDYCAFLSKRAILRPLGQRHPDPAVAELEAELEQRVEELGIGPQGLGGRTTALALAVEIFPTHIASLPVAVNIQCHSARQCTEEV